MKIKVISLASSLERRKSIQQKFDRLDVVFDFFQAITPEQAGEHIHHYDENEFFLNSGRYATETEIACYASHLALWRQCADEGCPYLILEDDAKPDDSFLSGLLVAAAQINKLGLIRVSPPNTGAAFAIDRFEPFDIQYCRRVSPMALGYALSPEAAKRLAGAAAIVEEPIDKFMQRFWRHGQPVFAVTPPFVNLARVAARSVIEERTRPKYGVSTWILRAARKAQNSISRTSYNLAYMHRALRGQINS